MKARALLLALMVALMTHGSSCINEGFLIPINLSINPCYTINSGPVGSFIAKEDTVLLANLIDESFRDNIKDARYYDIRVTGNGSFSGNVVGTVSIRSSQFPIAQVLLYVGGGSSNATAVPWSTFSTPQSLLGSSPYIRTSAGGVAILVDAMKRLATDSNTSIYIRAAGQTSGATSVPAGLSICIEILGQVDAQLNGGDGGD
jgi:hypothetical protein